jgi:hypothetical protein
MGERPLFTAMERHGRTNEGPAFCDESSTNLANCSGQTMLTESSRVRRAPSAAAFQNAPSGFKESRLWIHNAPRFFADCAWARQHWWLGAELGILSGGAAGREGPLIGSLIECGVERCRNDARTKFLDQVCDRGRASRVGNGDFDLLSREVTGYCPADFTGANDAVPHGKLLFR